MLKKIKFCSSRHSIPGPLRESSRSVPLHHQVVSRLCGFLTVILFSTELMRVLLSGVTVYLPRSLSCANY